MAIPKTIKEAEGIWRGKSKLHLAWLPEAEKVKESESVMSIHADRGDAFAKIDYTWHEDGKVQDGTVLICGNGEKDAVSAGWSDSWHQSEAVMTLVGTGMEGVVNLKGEYDVEGHPSWGWRIEFELQDQTLLLRMFNVSPEGQEEWAVRAEYSRAH